MLDDLARGTSRPVRQPYAASTLAMKRDCLEWQECQIAKLAL